MSQKFLFLSVNSSYSHSSLALPILHSAAENVSGWDWDVAEFTVAEDPAEAAMEIADKKPDLVGATLYLFNRNHLLDILGRFNALMPQTKIVLGGPECSGKGARDLLEQYSFIHDVFVGEAEGLFAEYLANSDKDSPRRIFPESGIAVYEKWHKKFPVNDIFFRADKAFVQVETSRGCPIGCKYCTSSYIPLRMKDLSDVERELALLQKRGVREVRLLDRTFNFPQWRGAALLKLFREKFADIEFHLEIHPQFLNDELKNELLIAPNLHVEAGVQSLSAEVQRAIGRNSKKSETLEGLKFLASCSNFETHADLICGLPEQNLESVLEDVLELLRCGVDEIQLETLKILNGTALAKDAADIGLVYSPTVPYDVMETADFPHEDILYCRKLSRILDIFHNHHALRRIFRKLSFESGNDLRKFTDFMLGQGIELKCVLDLKKRLLLLIEYVKKYHSSEAEFEIAEVWIRNNYPLNSIPFGTLKKFAGSIPSDIAEKHRDLFLHRETKIWTLEHNAKVFNFALNRHFKLNGAAASWE